MDRVKCDCGHVNPLGTKLCECCGGALESSENIHNQFIDMRYEGVTRHSEKQKKSVVDQAWAMFSSV